MRPLRWDDQICDQGNMSSLCKGVQQCTFQPLEKENKDQTVQLGTRVTSEGVAGWGRLESQTRKSSFEQMAPFLRPGFYAVL